MNNIRTKLFLIFATALFTIVSAFAQNNTISEKINYYNSKAKKYLDKSKALGAFYLVNENGINIYASSQNKTINKPEFHLNWNEMEAFKKVLKTFSIDELMKLYQSGKMNAMALSVENKNATDVQTQQNSTKKLQGLKIAIDPGHTAGDMENAAIEAEMFKF